MAARNSQFFLKVLFLLGRQIRLNTRRGGGEGERKGGGGGGGGPFFMSELATPFPDPVRVREPPPPLSPLSSCSCSSSTTGHSDEKVGLLSRTTAHSREERGRTRKAYRELRSWLGRRPKKKVSEISGPPFSLLSCYYFLFPAKGQLGHLLCLLRNMVMIT